MKVEVKEFHLLPHGFLQFNFPVYGIEAAHEAIAIGTECLRKMLNQ